MANKELKDIVVKKIAGSPQPDDDTIVGAQTSPAETDPNDRPYESWSWGAMKEWVIALFTWENISGNINDNEELQTQFATKVDEAPDNANAYVRFGLNWVIGYTKAAIDILLGNKQNTLVSGTNLKTVNGNSLLGSGDLSIGGSGSTNLGIANKTATTLDVTSDTGTDATIPQASTTEAGLLSATDKVKLNNTNGTNAGDETTATIKTKLGAASTSQDGYLTQTDWNTFNGKQAALGFTPENVANKNATNGYAGLSSGLIDGDQLPAISTTKKGAVPLTGTPTGRYLKDDGTWAVLGSTATFTNLGGVPNDNQALFQKLNTPLELYFKGKTLVWIGDSMVAGAGASPSTLRFSTLVSNRLGATEQNLGVGGSTIEKRTPVYSSRTNAIDMGATIPTKTSAIAGIVIAFGLNDVGLNSANYNVTNYKADYRTFLNASVIGKGYVASQILIIAPWYITTAGYNAYNASEGVPAADATRHLAFIQATEDIAREYGVRYLNPYNAEFNNDPTLAFLDADNIHRSNAGYEFDAALIMNALGQFQIGVNDTTDQDVAGYKRYTTGFRLGGTSGTNTGIQVTPSGVTNNLAVSNSTPTTGTATGISLQVSPRGTGLSAAIQAQHLYFGSDYNADTTNFNGLVIGSYQSVHRISSIIGGTGTRRPLVLDGNGSSTIAGSNMVLGTDGSVTMPLLAATPQLPLMVETATGKLIKSNTTFNNSNAIFNAFVGQNTTSGTSSRVNAVLVSSWGNSTFAGFSAGYTALANLASKTLISNEASGTGLVLHTASANGVDVRVGDVSAGTIVRITATGQRIFNNTTPSVVADSASIFAQDVSSSSVIQVHNENGDIIKLVSTGGWGTPTGTATRTTFATYAGGTASVTYVQADMQAVMDAVKVHSERLKALIDDLKTNNGILKA